MFKFSAVEAASQGSIENISDDLSYMVKQICDEKRGEISEGPLTFVCGLNNYIHCRGVAVIQKIELPKLQEDLRELVSTLPINRHVYQCSEIRYECEDKNLIKAPEEVLFYERGFYRGLYNALIEFGKLKGVSFLILKITSETYRATKDYGMWPYVVELKPVHSSDGLFYGILPLTGTQCQSYQAIST